MWNSYYFFSTYATIDKFVADEDMSLYTLIAQDRLTSFANPLDQWMLVKTMKLVNTVDQQLHLYNMQTSSLTIVNFMDDLTNWYIRRSRRRFWEPGE